MNTRQMKKAMPKNSKTDAKVARKWGDYSMFVKKGARGKYRWSLYRDDEFLAQGPIAGDKTEALAIGHGNLFLNALQAATERDMRISDLERDAEGWAERESILDNQVASLTSKIATEKKAVMDLEQQISNEKSALHEASRLLTRWKIISAVLAVVVGALALLVNN